MSAVVSKPITAALAAAAEQAVLLNTDDTGTPVCMIMGVCKVRAAVTEADFDGGPPLQW